MDSMQLKGKLIDALTGEPEASALVMLYKTDLDSLPLDTIPDFTRTDEAGHYHIKNVADLPYKIFVLKMRMPITSSMFLRENRFPRHLFYHLLHRLP